MSQQESHPLLKVKALGNKHYEAINGDNQDQVQRMPTGGGYTNAAYLASNPSEIYPSEENESEERLKKHCYNIGLKFGVPTSRTGNCFFEAVSAQLKRNCFRKDMQTTASDLRQKVVDHLIQNRELQSPDGPVKVDSFLSEPFDSWCRKMRQEGAFADHVVAVGTAQMLKVDIMIVTSSPNSNPEQTVLWIGRTPYFSENPVLLGHCWKNQYFSLEPTDENNIFQLLKDQRVSKLIENVLSDRGCTNPGQLHNALHESYRSMKTESEECLKKNCNYFGLNVSSSTPRNGNCFFEALSAQLKHLCFPQEMQMTASELRQKVVQHLSNNREFQSPDGPVKIDSFLSEPFDSWCRKMSQEGAFADHVVAVGTAQMLKVDIMIVTSSPNSNPEQTALWIGGAPYFSKNPVLLGHCWENGYFSLEPTEKSNIIQIWKTKRLSKIIETVMKDGECTNTGHLDSALRESFRSMEDESVERLKKNCRSIGLKFDKSTPRNGNCFFEAVSAQFKRRGLQHEKPMTAINLRKEVVEYLSRNREFQSATGPVQIDRFLSEPFDTWCNKMSQDGVYADHVVTVGTAKMLKVDIVIVTSAPNSNPKGFLTWIIGKPDFSGNPLLIGHCWENHYLSLEPTNKCNSIKISRNKRVSKITKKVMKGRGCTDPASLELILCDPSIVNESEKRLKENCNSVSLQFGISIPRNGNCFFEAVSAQLKRLCLPPDKQMTASNLRQQMVKYISSNQEVQTNSGLTSDFAFWSAKMSQQDVYADHIAIYGTAQMLKVDIVIVTSSPNNNPRQTVTWIVGDPNFSGDPILLGHCWQNHYQSLEPTKKDINIRQISTKQRVYEMRSYATKGGGCTTPGHLENILHYPESEKRLTQNCNSVGLNFGISTPRNGNCFFEAVSDQLRRLRLPRMTSSDLRQEVVGYLSENREFQSLDGPVQIEYFLSEPFGSWCTKMRQEGEFADHIVAVGTAQMLERDIVIVTSSPNSNPEQIVTWIVGKPDFSGDPLLLGHCWENHYYSLEPRQKSDGAKISTKERVSKMRMKAVKDFTCTCHKEILIKEYRPDNLMKGDHISRPLDCLCFGYMHCIFHHAIFERADELEEEQDGDEIREQALTSETEKNNKSLKTSITLYSIGFTAPEDETYGNKGEVTRKPEPMDLRKVDLYKAEYYYPKNTYEDVFTEAESVKKSKIPYNFILSNCEHLCRSCVTGEWRSSQVDGCNSCFKSMCFGFFPKLLRLILALAANLTSYLEGVHKYVAVIEIVATLIYVVMVVQHLVKSWFRYKSKTMCPKCFHKEMLSFVANIFFVVLTLLGIIFYWLEVFEYLRVEKLVTGLTFAALGYWLLLELYRLCSEKCRRNIARCLWCCFCFCCPFPSCCNKCCECICCTECQNDCFECLEKIFCCFSERSLK